MSLPRFSVANPVLVHILMLAIIAGGGYAGFTLVREMFPESRPNMIQIVTPYPGATPLEVEKGISIRLEEAIKDIEDIEKIETTITEGMSMIMVTMENDADDLDVVVTDFKNKIDAVPRDELPEDAEETTVARFEPRLPVISVAIYGDVDEHTLKRFGRELRDEILLLPDISDVVLSGTRKAELTVEVEPEKLVAYDLSLAGIAQTIRNSNLDLPAGTLRTRDQNIAVRTLGETDESELLEETVVATTTAGDVVRVADVGRVIDGFEDVDVRSRFNGMPGVDLTVYKTGDQDAIDIARKVQAFVAGKLHQPVEYDAWTRIQIALGRTPALQRIYEDAYSEPLPPTLQALTHSNLAHYVEDRLELLYRNGFFGAILVFVSLLIFLDWRIAFWVMMGLVLSVAGAVMLMQLVGATLNLISMFGLIVVLGLLVDDAIVVGENIYARIERGDHPIVAAVRGAEEVSGPVVIAVLTTIGAFAPLLFIEGKIGDFMGILPVVVVCALSVSLVESLLILPSHLAGSLKPITPAATPDAAAPAGSALPPTRNRLLRLIGAGYDRLLRAATAHRYVTLAAMVALTMMTLGLVAGGRVPFVLIQKMDSETLLVNLEMPVGTPVEQTEAALRIVENATAPLRENGEIRSIYTLVGAQIQADEGGATASLSSHIGQAIIELALVGERDRSSDEIINELRSKTTGIPGVNSLKYSAMQGGPAGAEIELEITGKSLPAIKQAAEVLKDKLQSYAGVFDIADDFEAGRREVQIALRDSARPLELNTRMLATEVRGAFYGLEARTLQRDREDVDIRVRFPENRRREIYEIENMRIATPMGMVPFREVASLEEGRGYATIRRVNQRRAVRVTADVDQNTTNADNVLASLGGVVTDLENRFPGLRIDFAGNKREAAKSLGSLRRDFLIALIVIYVMLAGLFRSYGQPLVVMAAVPFGLNGAIMGHLLMGYPMTILSTIGLVALTGIVVNDALILVDFINKERRDGMETWDAVIAAGNRRLRPILLTSLTTVFGLAPLMLEQSFQARFLIPMAISISFGLAFATVLTLLLVPALYLVYCDVKRVLRLKGHTPEAEDEARALLQTL